MTEERLAASSSGQNIPFPAAVREHLATHNASQAAQIKGTVQPVYPMSSLNGLLKKIKFQCLFVLGKFKFGLQAKISITCPNENQKLHCFAA